MLLLYEGWTRKQIRKHLKISDALVRRWTKFYEDKGFIVQTCDYPAMYRRNISGSPDTHTDGLVGDTHTEPQHATTIIPHKFGASFRQFKKPAILFSNGIAVIEKDDHTIIFRRHKTSIWLKHFTGQTVNEMLTRGEAHLKALAEFYSKYYGIKLIFDRIYPDIEWTDPSEERSKQIADAAGIKEFTRVKVAQAIHKFKDSSHETLEIERDPAHAPEIPTDHARAHEFVYSGKLAQALEAIGDAIITINQRLMKMEGKT